MSAAVDRTAANEIRIWFSLATREDIRARRDTRSKETFATSCRSVCSHHQQGSCRHAFIRRGAAAASFDQRERKMIRIKRTYEPPARSDGQRILVERLWPRGMKKSAVRADAWIKDVAPSTELRKWYGHRPERWREFRRRYRNELNTNQRAWSPLLSAATHGNVTLLYAAHDPLHNSAVVLREYLERRRHRTSKRNKIGASGQK
ncbi:MAG TPA: DUF488 family protein [Kofleriaceae bacterium]